MGQKQGVPKDSQSVDMEGSQLAKIVSDLYCRCLSDGQLP